MATRKPKVITKKEDIEYIAHINEKDITTSFFMEMFGKFDDKSRFNTYDEITIPPGSYGKDKKNKNSFTTTVGIYVFNKYFIEQNFMHLFDHGYINEEITDDVFGRINKVLSYALLEDDITVDQLKEYLLKTQKTMPYVSIVAPNYTEKMLTCSKAIGKKKEELLKKYKKEIEAEDELTAIKIEKELLDYAKEYMDGDPSMDIFLSGARGSISNNFKNMFVMKGPVKDPDPNAEHKFHIAKSNLIDGIKPEEYSLFANSLAAGPYSRAKKTEIGGELETLFLYAYQDIMLDEPGSDCGTKRYIKVNLTKKNISDWMYCYVIEGDKLVEITSKNMNKYIGKTVKMRFSSLCESKNGKICNKCMGNSEYRREEYNPGIATTSIASTMKNISMKSFHDSVAKMTTMDIRKAFSV